MNQMPREEQPKQPPEDPQFGGTGPRTSYPVDAPIDPKKTGSEPDYFPGKPGGDRPQLRERVRRLGRRRPLVSWQQAH
jgi:hypothetical protein